MPTDITEHVIEVINVSKQIGGRSILEQVSLTVERQQICGISGHNGAGKSILLRIIAGLIRPSEGQVRVFNEAIGEQVEFPRSTGAMIDGPGFLPHYSGFKNLQLLAMIRNAIDATAIADAMRSVGLNPQDTKPVRTYSTGMRQRLGLAQAMMEKPQLLLLDEPTSAIDRDGRARIHQLLRELNAQGVTIVLTSHSNEELATLCDTIFYMESGRLLAAETSAAIM
jgi:ABC-2 type transport system ATP-binding protein